MTSFRSLRLLAILASAFLGAFSTASANIAQAIPEFGDLDRWAIVTLGESNDGDRLNGDSLVMGDVAVAGNGDISLANNAVIQGDLYYRSNGTLILKDNGTVTGSQFHNQDALLDLAVSRAIAAARAAADLDATRSFRDVNLDRGDALTVSGAPGETVVLSLRDFRMKGNSVLTLQGSATTTFIINVKRQFSLSDNAQIVLSGGVQFNDVLFNVRGEGAAAKIGDNARLEGVLMANRRTVRLKDNALVRGTVIADRVLIGDGARIDHPPAVSP